MYLSKNYSLLYTGLSTFMMLLSCDNSNTYIISKQDSLFKASHTDFLGTVIIPPKVKYALYSFVIDSTDRVFFYSIPEGKPTGGVHDDFEPDFLYLLPNDIVIIPKGAEKSFFEENVLKQKTQSSRKSIMVASFKDTINVPFLKFLTAITEDKKNNMSLDIRIVLPEEREVIKHKVN